MIERFEDLLAWQRARELARLVYAASNEGSFARDYGLRDQANRAAASICANIAEGFDRGGGAEFHQFLSVAKGSCAELRSHLYVALDRGHVSNETFNRLGATAEEVARLVGGLRAAVQRQRDRSRNQSAGP